MNRSCPYLVLTCLALLLTACHESSAPRPLAEVHPVWDDSVYCFNQRSIVTLKGLQGIVDTDGRTVLAPEWDGVEFLDDNIALLCKSGIWSLCTRDGRVFAQSLDLQSLENSYLTLYEEMLEGDRQYWDRVLDCLEELEESCLAAPSRKLDDKIVRAHAKLQKRLSDGSGGRMTASQLERLDKIETDFKSMYRK